jgi:hypothetical protein
MQPSKNKSNISKLPLDDYVSYIRGQSKQKKLAN